MDEALSFREVSDRGRMIACDGGQHIVMVSPRWDDKGRLINSMVEVYTEDDENWFLSQSMDIGWAGALGRALVAAAATEPRRSFTNPAEVPQSDGGVES